MSQVHRSVIAPPLVAHGRQAIRRSEFFVAIVATAVLIAAFIVTSIAAAPATIRGGGGGDLVDGWMPVAGSARAAQLDRTQDGYLPGLLSGRTELVDGWLPSVAGVPGADDPRDGWEAGLSD
jgi:hypothetical protein